jgi:hypothetical protein
MMMLIVLSGEAAIAGGLSHVATRQQARVAGGRNVNDVKPDAIDPLD